MNKINEILGKLYYDKVDYKSDVTIEITKDLLLKAILECVPEKKDIAISVPSYLNDIQNERKMYNKIIDQTTTNLTKLFEGEGA